MNSKDSADHSCYLRTLEVEAFDCLAGRSKVATAAAVGKGQIGFHSMDMRARSSNKSRRPHHHIFNLPFLLLWSFRIASSCLQSLLELYSLEVSSMMNLAGPEQYLALDNHQC